jgi:hypothetical protein
MVVWIPLLMALMLGAQYTRKDSGDSYFGRENTPYDENRVYVRSQPPLPREEETPPSPDSSYVWQAGYWRWEDDAWRWISGKWVQPPYPEAKWQPGVWERQEDVWVWREGQWT